MSLAIAFNPLHDYHRHHRHHHHHHHPFPGDPFEPMPLAIAYKNFAAKNPKIKHIGLGVSALNTVKVLRDTGVNAHVWPTESVEALEAKMIQFPHINHVVINAPWIDTHDLNALCGRWPDRHIYMNVHSNVGFLQADSEGVRKIKEAAQLEQGLYNFKLAGNSAKFCQWFTSTYRAPCMYLPNLYYLTPQDGQPRPPWQREGVLRVGSFGALRPLKNQMTAAAATLELGSLFRTDVEFHLSDDRVEGGGDTVKRAMQQMYANHPSAKLLGHGWAPWGDFRLIVPRMHLLINPSYTESFSMVTADGIASGVPVVTSSAIDWAPSYWQANLDDVHDVVRVAEHLLLSNRAVADGVAALKAHNRAGTAEWQAMERLQ